MRAFFLALATCLALTACTPSDGVPPMAYDLTTFTEIDPNAAITVTSSTITVTDIPADANATVYTDLGVDAISGDFEYWFKLNIASGAPDPTMGFLACLVTQTTVVDDVYAYEEQESIALKIHADGDMRILEVLTTPSYVAYEGDVYALSLDTDYWVKFIRDESIGTYGGVYAELYSDASRSTLVATVGTSGGAFALHDNFDLRYLHAVGIPNQNSPTSTLSLTVSDFGEAEELIGAEASATLPALTLSATGYVETGFLAAELPLFEALFDASGPYANFAATLPFLGASLTSGGEMALTVEALEGLFTGLTGRTGALSATLPLPAYLSYTGGKSVLTLPRLESLLTGVTGNIGGFSVALPAFAGLLEGVAGQVGTMVLSLPKLSGLLAGSTEHTAALFATMPTLEALLSGYNGAGGTMNLTLPQVEALLTAYQDITGDAVAVLPALRLAFEGQFTGRFDQLILRWSRPQ